MESKKIIIDLTKEEEEDKELIELLQEKKNKSNIDDINDKIINKNTYINNIKKNFKVMSDMNIRDNKSNIYELNLKGDIHQKIDEFYSDRSINKKKMNKNKEEKNQIIKMSKPKNVSANTNSKNSHVSRILNLKKLKSQNNIIDNNNKTKPLIDNFNKGTKYIRGIDFISKNNSEVLNATKNNQTIENKYLPKTGKQIQNKIIKNNINDDTPSGSTLSHTKKYIINSINSQNLTEEQNHKFRFGLLSACSNSNNNIFIPFVSIQRPLSNFNIGGQMNIDNLNSKKIFSDSKQIKLDITKKNFDKIKTNYDMRQKINTAPAKKRKEHEYSYLERKEKKKNMNKNYSNLFGSTNIYGQKLHHIKIDRSLMNNKLRESLNKNMILNYINLGQNRFPKIKNNFNNSEIKKIFNIKTYSTKN